MEMGESKHDFSLYHLPSRFLQHNRFLSSTTFRNTTHSCPECHYEVERDIASAQELCNRGQETYPGTLEKQEIASQIVVLSGVMSLDKWRRGGMPSSDVGKPALDRLR